MSGAGLDARKMPSSSPNRCGVRYGKGLVCKRLSGHRGNHSIRPSADELAVILLRTGARR